MSGKYFMPAVGQIYINRNGQNYRCTGNAAYADDVQRDRAVALGDHRASMLRLSDGWAVEVLGIHQYEDRTVEWNHSVVGSFQCESLARCQRKCKERGADMGKYFTYLDGLRRSGIVNMHGATPYLQRTFPELSDDYTWAREILVAWMGSYGRAES